MKDKKFDAVRMMREIRDKLSKIYSKNSEAQKKDLEEFFKKIEKEKVLENVSRMFDKLILEDKLLNGIDKTKLLNSISEMLNELSPEQMKIPEDELFERIRGVLALEAVSGILNELTPEEMKVFDEAVKRRPLFK